MFHSGSSLWVMCSVEVLTNIVFCAKAKHIRRTFFDNLFNDALWIIHIQDAIFLLQSTHD